VSYLGQSVHNCQKGIIFGLSPRQSHDEIHSNFFLLPLRYLQKLQHPSESLMLDLDSLTCVAKSNILSNVSLNSVPPIVCLEIMVHLIPSEMNGISGLMSLSEYLILQFFDLSHLNSLPCLNLSHLNSLPCLKILNFLYILLCFTKPLAVEISTFLTKSY
jgi:hypothetical protein